MKKLSLLSAVILIIALLAGCTSNADNSNPEENQVQETQNNNEEVKEEPKEATQVTIAGLKGPTSIGMIKMIDEKTMNSQDYKVEYIAESP